MKKIFTILFLFFLSTLSFAWSGFNQKIELNIHENGNRLSYPPHFQICFKTTDVFDLGHCLLPFKKITTSNTYNYGPKNWRLYTHKHEEINVIYQDLCYILFGNKNRTPNENGKLTLDVSIKFKYHSRSHIEAFLSDCHVTWTPNN